MSIELNLLQAKAKQQINEFIETKGEIPCMLLTGPAGSGKTFITSMCLPKTGVFYAAFTNKASKVLKTAVLKNVDGNGCGFGTIHKMLVLDPQIKESYVPSKIVNSSMEISEVKNLYDLEAEPGMEGSVYEKPETSLDNDDGYIEKLDFSYDYKKTEYLKDYKFWVFDECSTISTELYEYIMSTYRYMIMFNVKPQLLFLGDIYQLPPVKEKISSIFKIAVAEWPIAKLNKIMRSENLKILQLNKHMYNFMKTENYDIEDFPKNILGPGVFDIKLNSGDLISAYCYDENIDKILLTYTNKNCDETNFKIQCILDGVGYDPKKNVKFIQFKENDRCVLDMVVSKSTHTLINGVYVLQKINKSMIYSGDVFIVLEADECLVKTSLTGLLPSIGNFKAQKLTIQNVSDEKEVYEVFWLDPDQVTKAKMALRRSVSFRIKYSFLMKEFNAIYPVLKRGYCMTVYKAQGSQYENVYVNLNSFYYTFVKDSSLYMNLYKSVYTACSRAKSELFVSYYIP